MYPFGRGDLKRSLLKNNEAYIYIVIYVATLILSLKLSRYLIYLLDNDLEMSIRYLVDINEYLFLTLATILTALYLFLTLKGAGFLSMLVVKLTRKLKKE